MHRNALLYCVQHLLPQQRTIPDKSSTTPEHDGAKYFFKESPTPISRHFGEATFEHSGNVEDDTLDSGVTYKFEREDVVPTAMTPVASLRGSHRVDGGNGQPLLISGRCSLEVDMSMLCSQVLTMALDVENNRIQAEISKYVPKWVQRVNLQYLNGRLLVEPVVQIKSAQEHSLFGLNPDRRLRCTFESLLRSSQVLRTPQLLSNYSGGLCSLTIGAGECESTKSQEGSCDPLRDVLIHV